MSTPPSVLLTVPRFKMSLVAGARELLPAAITVDETVSVPVPPLVVRATPPADPPRVSVEPESLLAVEME